MSYRAAIILLKDDRLALIERHRQGQHYFTFPGGHVEPGETPEQAAIREAAEELGLEIRIQRLVAIRNWRGKPQYYFLVQATGGEFGTGQGEEMSAPSAQDGTYLPVWMPLATLLEQPIKPREIAELVVRFVKEGWPDEAVMLAGG